jgi:transposase
MKIVGCDLHTRYQQIAMLDNETGELMERRREHANGESKQFYAQLSGPVRVGIEATGHTRWFERLLAELGYELWVGDAARIRAAEVRKQKTDARDAALLPGAPHIHGFRMCGKQIVGSVS